MGLYFWSGGTLTRIVDGSMHIPNDPMNHYFGDFFGPILADTGHVTFTSTGVYRWDGGSLIVIADRWVTPVPGHPEYCFVFPRATSINDSDIVAFVSHGGGWGVYTGDGISITKVADVDTPVPGQPGASFPPPPDASFQHATINSSGDVVFKGSYVDGEGYEGLYIHTSGALQRIADGSTIPPNQTAPLRVRYKPSLNACGQVAFQARGESSSYQGQYLWTAGQLEVIADPNTGFNGPGYPRINDNGVAAYQGANFGLLAIVKVKSGVMEFVALAGDPIPGQPDTKWEYFWSPSINASDAVTFRAQYSSLVKGIFTDMGGSLVKVVDTEDILVDGLSASDLMIVEDVDLGGSSPFNDVGQVAFWAKLSDGREGVFLANPVFVPDNGDFSGNGKVDFTDFAIFALYWQATDCCIQNGFCHGADHEPDCDVDLNDLEDFAVHWLEGTIP